MQIVIKPKSMDIEDYIKLGIHNYLLPLKDYSTEYTSFFQIEEIRKLKEKYKDIHLFVSLNKNIFNRELKSLEKTLIELDKIGIEAVFFYDQAVLSMKKRLNLGLDLVWAQTHMVTNYNTCNYYYHNGVDYALLSKEITIDEIIEIKKNSQIKSIVELISIPSVATSRRKLVTNYYQDIRKKRESNLSVLEKVSGDTYTLIENKEDLTFYKNCILNGSIVLDCLLEHDIDYILLKEDLIDSDIFKEAVKNISHYIANYPNLTKEEKEKFVGNQEKLLGNDTLFFFQKTIYRVK